MYPFCQCGKSVPMRWSNIVEMSGYHHLAPASCSLLSCIKHFYTTLASHISPFCSLHMVWHRLLLKGLWCSELKVGWRLSAIGIYLPCHCELPLGVSAYARHNSCCRISLSHTYADTHMHTHIHCSVSILGVKIYTPAKYIYICFILDVDLTGTHMLNIGTMRCI